MITVGRTVSGPNFLAVGPAGTPFFLKNIERSRSRQILVDQEAERHIEYVRNTSRNIRWLRAYQRYIDAAIDQVAVAVGYLAHLAHAKRAPVPPVKHQQQGLAQQAIRTYRLAIGVLDRERRQDLTHTQAFTDPASQARVPEIEQKKPDQANSGSDERRIFIRPPRGRNRRQTGLRPQASEKKVSVGCGWSGPVFLMSWRGFADRGMAEL